MLDVINAGLLVSGLVVLVWLGWTANKTILDFGRVRSKAAAVREWVDLLLISVLGFAIFGLGFLINHFASGR